MDPTAQHLVTLWQAAQSAAQDALLDLSVQHSTSAVDVVHVMTPPVPPAAAVAKPKPRARPVRAPAAPVARPRFELTPVALWILFAILAIILIGLWGCAAPPSAYETELVLPAPPFASSALAISTWSRPAPPQRPIRRKRPQEHHP